MNRIVVAIAVGAIAAALGFPFPAAAQSVEEFYKGKRIDYVIGSNAGSSYDLWARTIGRHMGRHIPGNPTFLPKNMPGASSLVATNFLYSQAARDGTTMGQVSRSVPLQEVLNHSAVRFKAAEFGWLGSGEPINHLCVAMPSSKVKTGADLFKEELLVGGTGSGSNVSNAPKLLGGLLGMKFKLVEGYGAQPAVLLAMERGEVEGICSSMSGIEATRPGWIAEGKLTVLFNMEEKPVVGVPGITAPSVYSFAQTDEQRQILAFFTSGAEIGWPVLTTPGVPKDRLDALRRAYDATMKDKEFLAEAAHVGLRINALTGEELDRIVARLIRTPKSIVDKTIGMVGSLGD